jgi:cytidine diphosphoramidate kinase
VCPVEPLPSVAEPERAPVAGAPREGRVIWIIGLSGVGKSTVANQLVEALAAEGTRPILFDGDELRSALGATGFDRESPRRLGCAHGPPCRLLAGQGHTVICAAIGLLHELHEWNRANLSRYVEVLLDVPRDELERRDSKGLYGTDAERSEVVGVDLPAEFPKAPDLVIRNFGSTDPRAAAELILDFLRSGDDR